IRPEQRFVIHASPFRLSPSGPVTVWVAGELQGPAEEFATGASASIEISGGAAVAESTATLKPGERAFLVKIPVQAATTAAFDIRVRMTPAAGGTPVMEDRKSTRLNSS